MNSIINPWVFYWIGIVDSQNTTNRHSNRAYDRRSDYVHVYYERCRRSWL